MYINPVHVHDCEDCLFLGGETVIDGRGNLIKYDYYVCPEDATYVARFGELGDCFFGIPEITQSSRLQAAQRQAERLGVQL